MTDHLASFAARLCLTAEVIARRGASIHRQTQIVQSLWPNAVCRPIGSFPTRTSLRHSDVDLLVSIPGQSDERNSVVAAAACMREAIINHRIAKPQDCTVLAGARVPILTYMDESETPPLKFDISFQKENGILNTGYLIEKFNERPFMRDLVIILKHWLREKQLNEVYKGGLGSYAVSLTVIGFFNFKRRTLDREGYQAFITGSRYNMFVEYLEFWTGWKYKEDTMIPDPLQILTKRQGKQNPGFMLRIIDPIDPENDVGRGSHKIPKIVSAMAKLKQGIKRLGPGVEESELDRLLSGTQEEKEIILKQKVHQDRNNSQMYNKMQNRIKKLERRKLLSKSMEKTLRVMKEKLDEFLVRRPAFAAEIARAEYLLAESRGPEQDRPGPEHDPNHDTLMVGPENEEKSPEQLEREAKHAATIERKRQKREKLLKKREERKKKDKERKARFRAELAMKRQEEKLANMRPNAGKQVMERAVG